MLGVLKLHYVSLEEILATKYYKVVSWNSGHLVTK